MPIAGTKEVFAIEWQNTGEGNGYIFAKFCFWANDIQIGDFDDEVVFGAVRGFMREFLARAGDRHIECLDGKTKEEVFAHLYESVIDCAKPGQRVDDLQPRTEEIDYERASDLISVFHLVDIGGAAFRDKVSIVLLDDHSQSVQRLIWRDMQTWELRETILPAHRFDEVAESFLELSS